MGRYWGRGGRRKSRQYQTRLANTECKFEQALDSARVVQGYEWLCRAQDGG